MTVTAQTAEQAGFHSLWAPEHVVLINQYASQYPYSQDGRLPMSTQVDILDPFTALTFAAATTTNIRLGTGSVWCRSATRWSRPKEVASLDKLSGGRFDFGVGIGWLAEEFDAVGVPWPRRAQRTPRVFAGHEAAVDRGRAEFNGEFCSFPKSVMLPKPVQKPHPPIIFGGESTPALKRVGEVGDGWFGVNVSFEAAQEKIPRMKEYATAAGRDPEALSFAVSPGLGSTVEMEQIKRYRDLGWIR